MKRQGLSILSVMMLAGLNAAAQKPASDTALKQTTIEVIQAYKPEVRKMSRPELEPDLPPVDTTHPAFTYVVPQQTLYYTYRSLPLRPLMLTRDSVKQPFPGYMKLGGGNLSTLYIDAGTAHLRGDNYQSAISLHHISQEGDLKYQKTSLSSLNARADFKALDLNWNAALEALRYQYYNYGYDHKLYDYKAADVRNTYTGLQLSLGGQSMHLYGDGFGYTPAIALGIYSDGKDNTERSFNASLGVTKRIDTSFVVGLNVDARLAYYQSPVANIGNNILSFSPYATYADQAVQARLSLSPTFGRNGNAYLLPDLFISYQLPSYPILLTAGWRSELQQNTFRELTMLNPYLSKGYETKQTRKDEVFAGAAMSMGNHFSFGARFSYWQFNNMPLMLNDTGNGRDFRILYDGDVKAISFRPYLAYQVGTVFNARIGATFYNFTSHSFDRLWHVPTTEIRGDLSFSPVKNLTVQAYLVMLDGIYGRATNGTDVKLSTLVDGGGGAEYRFIPRLAAFGNVNNILNTKNQRWLGYNAYGFNIFAGLRLSF